MLSPELDAFVVSGKLTVEAALVLQGFVLGRVNMMVAGKDRPETARWLDVLADAIPDGRDNPHWQVRSDVDLETLPELRNTMARRTQGVLFALQADNLRDAMVQLAAGAPDGGAARQQIATALDIALYTDEAAGMFTIAEPVGVEGDWVVLNDVFVREPDSRLRATGLVPRVVGRLQAQDIALPRYLFMGSWRQRVKTLLPPTLNAMADYLVDIQQRRMGSATVITALSNVYETEDNELTPIFRYALVAISLGLPTDEALRRMAARAHAPELTEAAEVVIAAAKPGADAVALLRAEAARYSPR